MIKSLTRLRKYCIFTVFVIIAISVSSAFAIVWMQQQISRTAQESKLLEAQLAETTRKLQFLDERIAGFHQPIVLQGKVAGILRPSMEDQVVFVEEREQVTGRSYAVMQPYQVSTDLALLDLSRSR